MRSANSLLAVFVMSMMAACTQAGSNDAVAVVTPSDTLPAMQAIGALAAPATWEGPATSDARETITLFPDGTLRLRHMSDGARDTVAAFGRWTLAREAARITLFAGREAPQRFALQDTLHWRSLSSAGAERPVGASTLWRRAALDSMTAVASMVGAFVYMADAAILTECVSGRQYPVAMEDGYLELERQYGASVSAGGAPLVVRVRARLGDAAVGEGDGRSIAVIVDSVERVGADSADTGSCPALALRRTVNGATWTLTELEGTAVDTAGGRGAPTLTMDVPESRIAGSDGCNRYTGRGVLRGVELAAVGPLAVTRMMCSDPGVMERADRFARVLSDGGWFRLEGGTLVLSRGPREVARFAPAASSAQR